MHSYKTAAVMIAVVAMCAVTAAAEVSHADTLPYGLAGEIPEYPYSGLEIRPEGLQTIEAAPGYDIVSSGLIGGDVVPCEQGITEEYPFGYEPAAKKEAGTYRLVYETVVSDGTAESRHDVTLQWRIVPLRVDVSGFADKVYDGSVAVRDGITVTAGGSEEIPGITGMQTYFVTEDAGEGKDLRIRVSAEDIGNYSFHYGDAACTAEGGYVYLPGAGRISPAPAGIAGDPSREYDGTDLVTSPLTVTDRVDPIKVESAVFLGKHAGTGVGVSVRMSGAPAANYEFTFMGVSGTADGDTVTFAGVGDILRRSVSPIWGGEDYYFYTGEALDLPPAEPARALPGDAVRLRTECVPADREFMDVGEYTVRAVLDGDFPDYTVTNALGHFQIDPAPVRVTGSADREYDGTKAARGIAVEGMEPVSAEFADRMAGTGKDVILRFAGGEASNLMFSYTREDGTPALGTVGDGGGSVLLPGYGTVLPREVSLEWTAPPVLTYSGRVLEGPSVAASGLIGGDLLPLEAVTGGVFMDAGTYVFSPESVDGNPNYRLPAETAEYTVEPARAAVEWTYPEAVYDGSEQPYPEASVTGMSDGRPVPSEVVLLGATRFADAGTYTFEAVSADGNYEVSERDLLRAVIARAPLTLTGTAHKTFDGSASFGGVLTLEGAVDGIEVVGKSFAGPGAGPYRDVSVTFTPGKASNYDMVWDGVRGVPDGDSAVFPGRGVVDPRPIEDGDIGGRFVQTGDELRLFVTVSSDALVCRDFSWTSGGVDYTDAGMRVEGSSPVPVTVSAHPGSDWTGSASASLEVGARYVVTVTPGSGGSVSGGPASVVRGTPVSWSGGVLTVGDHVFSASPDDGYGFGSWYGVPSSGRVDSDISVRALFAEEQRPVPPPVSLLGIDVAVPPDRVEYGQGDAFDPAGMRVVAHFSNGVSHPVDGYSFAPKVLIRGGPAVEVEVSYQWATASVYVKVEGARPIPPSPVVRPEVDVPVGGGVLSESEAAEAVAGIEAVREYDPDMVPAVSVHSDDRDSFTVPSSLYRSVRESGASLEVSTVTGSVTMQPCSASGTELPDGDLTVRISAEDVTDGYRLYTVSLSSGGDDLPVAWDMPAEAVLEYPFATFGDSTGVYLVSDDGSRTEVADVTYSEVGGEAYISFPMDVSGTYAVQHDAGESGWTDLGWTLLILFVLVAASLAIAIYLSTRAE